MLDLLALIAGQAVEILVATPKEAPAPKAAQIAAQAPAPGRSTVPQPPRPKR